MNVGVAVLDITERGVQVALRSTASAFWLPRHHPAVTWSAAPEPGRHVSVRLPKWLIAKHSPLRGLCHQVSMSFHAPPGLNPTKASAEGSFPMTNDNELRGVLFREQNKKSEKAPDMTGHLTVGGVRYRLAGWTREGKDGRKFLSLAAEPPKDQQQRQQQEPQNSYAAAGAKRAPDKPVFDKLIDEEIPF